MGDRRLLLEVPDLAWAGILQGLTNDPQTILDLELVCKQLRQRQRPLLDRLCARLQVAHRAGDQVMKRHCAELERSLSEINAELQGGWSAHAQKLTDEAEVHVARSRNVLPIINYHCNGMKEEYGPNALEKSELIEMHASLRIHSKLVAWSLISLYQPVHMDVEEAFLQKQELEGK